MNSRCKVDTKCMWFPLVIKSHCFILYSHATHYSIGSYSQLCIKSKNCTCVFKEKLLHIVMHSCMCDNERDQHTQLVAIMVTHNYMLLAAYSVLHMWIRTEKCILLLIAIHKTLTSQSITFVAISVYAIAMDTSREYIRTQLWIHPENKDTKPYSLPSILSCSQLRTCSYSQMTFGMACTVCATQLIQGIFLSIPYSAKL